MSKAALISQIAIVFIIIIRNSILNKNKYICISKIFICVIGILLVINIFTTNIDKIKSIPLIGKNVSRVLESQEDDSLYYGRGYGRIESLEEKIIFGMGEGGYKRFEILKGYEVHSTYASILVSYGLVGLILFLKFEFKILNGLKGIFKYDGFIFITIALYSITHNGVRNTMLFIAYIIFYLSRLKEELI